jgi:hypothetical protein
VLGRPPLEVIGSAAVTRSLVSFEADEASFPTGGVPAGRELAAFVSDALEAGGIDHDGPGEREGWAWDMRGRRTLA